MASSQNFSVQLAGALRARDEARKLGASDEVLRGADAEVERIKLLINDRLGEIAMELDGLRREQRAQEDRYKSEEYTEAQFRNATADIRRRIASLERLESSFEVLLEAETEADMRHTSRPPVTSIRPSSPASVKEPVKQPVKELVKEPVREPVREAIQREAAPVQKRVAGATGWRGIPAPKWMLLASGALIAVGVVAIVILLLQTAFGSFSLPSLFQGDDGTVSAPPASVDTTPSSTTAPAATVAPATTQFQVPIQVRGASGVGSLYLELQYDPAAIEVVRLDAAGLPVDTLFESSFGGGRVAIGVASSAGLKVDNMVLAYVTCKRAAGASGTGTTAVTVGTIQAYQAIDLSEMQASASDGSVNLSSLAVLAPAIQVE